MREVLHLLTLIRENEIRDPAKLSKKYGTNTGRCQVEQVLLGFPSPCLDKLAWMPRGSSTT